MKRYAAIAAFVYIAFLLEFFLYNAFNPWGTPELMVLVIVFCALYWGIRHALWAAFVAGLLKDAFGIQPFGTYVAIYIAAAFLTIWVRQNIYQPGSRFSRGVVAFIVLVGVFALEFVLRLRLYEISLGEAMQFILVPQTVLTMIVATFVFHRLRDIVVALKL